MLASSRRIEAMTNLPPSSDHRLGAPPWRRLVDIYDGLHADRRVLVRRRVVHRKAGPFEEAEVYFSDFDAAPQRAAQRRLQTIAILVGGEAGQNPGDHEREHQRADQLESLPGASFAHSGEAAVRGGVVEIGDDAGVVHVEEWRLGA